MTRLATLTAAALMAAFLMTAAKAQQMPVVCQPHAKIAEHLRKAFSEVVVANGVAGNALFEVYASAAGTWTVLVTRPSMGLACVQGTGTDFSLTGNKFPAPKSTPS